jgi:lipopolysaccharide export system protein LptA
MYLINKRLWLLFLSSLAISYSSVTLSVENDNQEPIYIDSDTASYDEKTSISTYTGNVIYTQGSLSVHSDVMTFYMKDGQITKITVAGKPATFKQTLGTGKEDINGHSLMGEYYPPTAKLFLIKEAVVWQGGNKSSSDLIVYDTKNSVIKGGDPTTGSKRVHTVFEPKAKNDSKAKTELNPKK